MKAGSIPVCCQVALADTPDTLAHMSAAPYPKIELHVHLEGTVRAKTLLEIA
ncbi:MAG TPA: hypothetical protein VHQ89_04675 [Gaiellaceae bacterium]|nr:hypothetical protein [Gaiellaceae bacterium]